MPSAYYSLQIAPGWRLIALDTTELSWHSGYSQDSHQMAETRKYAEAHPVEVYPCMTTFNGGVASIQMHWLEQQLSTAKTNNEHVMIACHHPVGAGSCRPTHMAWNAADIQKAITSSGVVPLVLSGHDHQGGYALIEGTHFVTVRGLVEAPEGSTAFAIVHVYDDAIQFEGYGVAASHDLAIASRAGGQRLHA